MTSPLLEQQQNENKRGRVGKRSHATYRKYTVLPQPSVPRPSTSSSAAYLLVVLPLFYFSAFHQLPSQPLPLSPCSSVLRSSLHSFPPPFFFSPPFCLLPPLSPSSSRSGCNLAVCAPGSATLAYGMLSVSSSSLFTTASRPLTPSPH